jgi:hypothetical protein
MGEFPHFPAGLMFLSPGVAGAIRWYGPGAGFVAGLQDVS